MRIAALVLLLLPTTTLADGLDIAVGLAAGADLASTEYALRTGQFRELNPFLQDQGARIGVKLAAATVVIWTSKKLEKDGHKGWSKGLRIGVVMIWGGVAAWNLHRLRDEGPGGHE